MFRKSKILLTLTIFIASGLFFTQPAHANSTITGEFVSANYEEFQIDKKTTEKRLSSVTIKNENGRTSTLNIDKFAYLSVDSVPVKIEAFKLGMEIEAEVNLRRIKSMNGFSGVDIGEIEHRDKIVTGTVNQLDASGEFLSIRLDNGQTKTYYLNDETEVFKGTKLVDLSVMYEGDRIKLTFDEYDTNFISSIEVTVQGVKIESLYKGTISRIEPASNKIHLKDEMVFRDWKWTPNTFRSTSTYSYDQRIPIYVGDVLIKPDRLRQYAGNDLYFVTVSEFGKEVIKKMIIKKTNERTYYEPMTSFTTGKKEINLKTAGKIRYHDGTILIRNGRLVDSASLQAGGNAFVVTEGKKQSEFANVVHITNDGFQSPNLAVHSIYFGKINAAKKAYDLTLSDAYELSGNAWQSVSTPNLAFSNDTYAVRDWSTSIRKIVPQLDEMWQYNGEYAYFYIENGTIVAMHVIDKKSRLAPLVSVGRYAGYNSGDYENIRIQNVNQWQTPWIEAPLISSMNIKQATIIKDGKVIHASQLRKNDRIYLLHESSVKGRILLVN